MHKIKIVFDSDAEREGFTSGFRRSVIYTFVIVAVLFILVVVLGVMLT